MLGYNEAEEEFFGRIVMVNGQQQTSGHCLERRWELLDTSNPSPDPAPGNGWLDSAAVPIAKHRAPLPLPPGKESKQCLLLCATYSQFIFLVGKLLVAKHRLSCLA